MNIKGLILTALLLPTMAFAGPLDKAMKGLECQQEMDTTWERGYFAGAPAYLDTTVRKLKGKVDQTIVIPNGNWKLQRVVFAVDTHLPDDVVDYKQSDRIWKTFNRKYGEPLTTDWAWFWALEDGGGIFMFTTGGGTAILVECPHD